jgi:hypothetical protein
MFIVYSDLFLLHLLYVVTVYLHPSVVTDLHTRLNAIGLLINGKSFMSEVPPVACPDRAMFTDSRKLRVCVSATKNWHVLYYLFGQTFHRHVRLVYCSLGQCPCNQNLKDVKTSPS